MGGRACVTHQVCASGLKNRECLFFLPILLSTAYEQHTQRQSSFQNKSNSGVDFYFHKRALKERMKSDVDLACYLTGRCRPLALLACTSISSPKISGMTLF